MKICFTSLQDLCHELIGKINVGTTRFSPRPYNYQNPDHTLWWLVPSQNWPAYKFGKIALYVENHSLNIGLNIEKGFAPIVAAAYPKAVKKQLVMDDHWQWNSFRQDVKNYIVDEHIKREIELSNEPFFVTISAGIATDPSDFDPDSPRSDKVKFMYSQEGMVLNDDQSGSILNRIGKSNSIAELIHKTDKIEELPWIWLDFYISRQFERSSEESDCLTINELYNVIEPFMKWVVG